MPRVSQRAERIPASPIRKLVPHAEAARARGVHVHHLNIGQPDLPTPAVMRDAVHDLIEQTVAYQPSAGRIDCIEFLRTYYARHGVELTHEELVVTTGASEALHFAFAAVTSPGEEILCPEPMYANYLGFAEMLGARIVPIPTQADDAWRLPADLAERVGPDTRAILLCNPGNPTGAVYREAALRGVLEVARAHDLFVIVDEVYREFVYEGAPPPSMLQLDEDKRVIVVDSFSKRYSMCGARLGCLASHAPAVIDCAIRLAQARLSTPLFAQLMGAKAAELDPDYEQRVCEIYRERVELVCDALEQCPGVSFRRPEGAFYVWAQLPVVDAEHFVRWMLDEFALDGETTMVAPGTGFFVGDGGRDQIRIACVLEPDVLRRAMRALEAGLRTYLQLHAPARTASSRP
jgi:aspartate aminotransferase